MTQSDVVEQIRVPPRARGFRTALTGGGSNNNYCDDFFFRTALSKGCSARHLFMDHPKIEFFDTVTKKFCRLKGLGSCKQIFLGIFRPLIFQVS